jgi:hypothetical protein
VKSILKWIYRFATFSGSEAQQAPRGIKFPLIMKLISAVKLTDSRIQLLLLLKADTKGQVPFAAEAFYEKASSLFC